MLAVIWVSGVLAVIATSLATSSRTETVLSQNRLSNAQARALADAGIHRAIYALLSGLGRDANAYSVNSPQLNGLAAQTNLPKDGAERIWTFAKGRVAISVRSESGKINLNGEDEELLEALLRAIDLPPTTATELAHSILDFRDPDSEPRTYGRETPGYAALGLKYGAKNRNFEALDELLLVPGVTRDIYRKLRPALTVYSASPGFNPSYAPAEVFMTQPGIDAERATDLVASRSKVDDETFRQLLPDSRHYNNSKAPVMTILAHAQITDGTAFTREAVVALTPNETPPYHIFTWQ